MLVHSATCNDGQTSDGIEAGGRRLAMEINDWIDAVLDESGGDSKNDEDDEQRRRKREGPSSTTSTTPIIRSVSLSLIGNSLGGLYARHALAWIEWKKKPAALLASEEKEIRPAVFATTVTPHLGVSAPHNYLKKLAPRWVEHGVAAALGRTGRDLIRVTDVIERLALEKQFVQPLAAFERRLALANAHNTDFQVACSTAAFLSRADDGDDDPSSPKHYRRVHGDDGGGALSKHVVLTVETERRELVELEEDACPANVDDNGDGDESANAKTKKGEDKKERRQQLSSDELAVRLDALGWTKVFCDVREHLFPLTPAAVQKLPSFGFGGGDRGNGETEIESIDSADGSSSSSSSGSATADEEKDEYTSSELWDRFGAFWPSDGDGRLRLPLGHQVLVANAKNDFYTQYFQGGQPVMDELAEDVVRWILSAEKQQQ